MPAACSCSGAMQAALRGAQEPAPGGARGFGGRAGSGTRDERPEMCRVSRFQRPALVVARRGFVAGE